MPTFISHKGKWYPQKEKVALKNYSKKIIKNPSTDPKYKGEKIEPGEDFIYSGGDRAALFELWRNKIEEGFLGQDFRSNPEFLQAVRNMGYTSYKKYLKDIGFNEEKVDKEFEEKAEVVNKHELPKRVEALDTLAGGRDTSGGGQDMKGDFSLPPGFQEK